MIRLKRGPNQLLEFGAAVHNARVAYIERLNSVLDENDHGRAIFGAERITVVINRNSKAKAIWNVFGSCLASV